MIRGYEGTRIRGYEGTRVRGYEGMIRGYEGTRIRDDTRIRGYEGMIRGYEDTRIRGYEDVNMNIPYVDGTKTSKYDNMRSRVMFGKIFFPCKSGSFSNQITFV